MGLHSRPKRWAGTRLGEWRLCWFASSKRRRSRELGLVTFLCGLEAFQGREGERYLRPRGTYLDARVFFRVFFLVHVSRMSDLSRNRLKHPLRGGGGGGRPVPHFRFGGRLAVLQQSPCQLRSKCGPCDMKGDIYFCQRFIFRFLSTCGSQITTHITRHGFKGRRYNHLTGTYHHPPEKWGVIES